MDNSIKIPAHIRIPRSLNNDPLWQGLSLKQQSVFYTLLYLVCFKNQKFDDHGILIDLEPGQICISIRELQMQSHRDFSKNDIERSIKKLILCGFLRQEVRHTKSILTITHSDTCELIKMGSETRSETTLRQDRDKIETQKKKEKKEKKEKKSNLVISADAEKLLFFFNSSLKQFVPEVADPDETNPSKSAKYFDELIKKGHTIPEIQAVITFAHKDDDFWPQYVHTPQYLKNKFAKILSKMRRGNPAKKNQQTDRTPKGPNGTEFENPHAGKF